MSNRKKLEKHLEKYMSDNGISKGEIWERRELLDIMEDAQQCVIQQRELLAFKDWFNNLPDESDDRLYITDETIDRFKANCT